MEGCDGQCELDGFEPHGPGAEHRERGDGGGQRGPFPQDHGGCARGDFGIEEHAQYDGGPAQRFRIGGEPGGARSGHGREAGRAGGRERRGRNVEGSHGQRELDGFQPHGSGPQHRGRGYGHRGGRPFLEDHSGGEGRNPRAEEHHEYDGGPVERLRIRSDARGS